MPSINVVPSSDITTTNWTSTGSNFYGVLAANSGAGDGTNYVDNGGGAGNLVMGCTLNTTGWTYVTGVTYTLAWEAPAKATSNFQLQLNSNGGSIELASMAGVITTTNNSEFTSGPTAMIVNNSSPANWTNFQLVPLGVFTAGDHCGNYFGLYVTITYATTWPPLLCDSTTGAQVMWQGTPLTYGI